MLRKFRRGEVWYIRGTVRGISVYETTGTSDTAQAEEYRARKEGELWSRDVRGDRGSHSFGEAAVIYLRTRRPAASSLDKMRAVVEHFERWQVDKVDQAAIDDYIARHHPTAAPATIVRVVITPVTAILRVAAKRGWCDMPALERPPVPTPAPRWLTREEADRLVAACSPHLAPLVTFLLHTGARLGEALSLRWAQVDLQARRVVFLDTKNGESRGVPLNGVAWLGLANLPGREGEVFRTPAGQPYSRSEIGGSPIKTAFSGACRRASLAKIVGYRTDKRGKERPIYKTDVRVHDLRHTFASWLVMAGVPLRTVAELLGHQTLQMVHRYSHLSPDHLRDAVLSLTRAPSVQAAQEG